MAPIIEKSNALIIPLEVPAPNLLKSINFYLVQKKDGIFLIDAGLDKDTYWEYLLQALETHGIQLEEITAILLTHHHFDHVGLAHRISGQYDIPVYVHPYALPILKGDPNYLYMNYLFNREIIRKMNTGEFGEQQIQASYERQMTNEKTALNWNTQPIQQDTLFGFQVIPVPGHAPDQVAFYLPEENILFSADLLIEHLRSNAFVKPTFGGTPYPALQQHINSLEKIIAIDPEVALSGHGKVIYEPAKLAKRRLKAINAKAASFLTMIEGGISTGSDIVKQRHPDKYEQLFITLMSDALSFLYYMEADGQIKKQTKNGIWVFKKSLS